jgi:hypothetical protein
MVNKAGKENVEEASPLTVLYDGACPLCRREISVYRGLQPLHPDAPVCFADVSDAAVSLPSALPPGTTREQLLAISWKSGSPLGKDAVTTVDLLLARLQPLWCRQRLNLTFNLIDTGELLQCKLSELTLVGRVQVEEFAPCVRQATRLCDTLSKAGFVSGVIVADQAATPVTQEGACVFARTRLAKVIDHGAHVFKRAWGIGPQVGSVRLAVAWLEHGHRCFVAV